MSDKPWETEPDKKEWTHEASGYRCLMSRHPKSKHWCGYVHLPKGHPLHGKHYSDEIKVPEQIIGREINIDKIGAINLLCATAENIEDGSLKVVLAFDVHGGLSYSRVEKDGTWCFGFDCAHAGDFSPGYPNRGNATYRDEVFVTDEVNSLASQFFASALWNEATQ